MTGTDLARLGRTVVHLRPGQVAHRARLRVQQAGLRRFPGAGRRVLSGPDPSAAVGWPDAFRPVDALTPGRWPGLPELRAGKIRLLGLVRELGTTPAGSTPTRPGCGVFTCTTGTGRGGWPRTRTGWPPGPCSPGCGGPGRPSAALGPRRCLAPVPCRAARLVMVRPAP